MFSFYSKIAASRAKETLCVKANILKFGRETAGIVLRLRSPCGYYLLPIMLVSAMESIANVFVRYNNL